MKKPTIVEGPHGLRMPDKTATYLESILKGVPKGNDYRYRTKNSLTDSTFEPGERASIDVITTDSVDKDFEVVLPDGMDLEGYRRNPIILFAHDQQKVIGRSLWIKQVGNGIKSKTLYATRPNDYQGEWLPDMVFALVQQDILKGRSIGFFPLEIAPPTQDQLKQRNDWKQANAIISKSVIFEYSIVSVPCNEDALTELVSKKLKGMNLKTLKALGLPIKKPVGKRVSDEALLLAMLERIKLNPDQIAERVINALKNRGQV